MVVCGRSVGKSPRQPAMAGSFPVRLDRDVNILNNNNERET